MRLLNHWIAFALTTLFCNSNAFILNATGGSFPNSVYVQQTFAYQFLSNDNIAYFGEGSGVGKCNIMGYWQTGNTDLTYTPPAASVLSRDSTLCTNPVRPDNYTRHPLVDFAGSDSVLGATDYKNFPDLQMFPAVAGAVVPIYNIPELQGIASPLVLSRTTIVGIFMGNIKQWNDPYILGDNANNKAVLSAISKVQNQINVVVRTDSSGTTQIFATALSAFSTTFASSAQASSTPTWCGKLTDEVQIFSITGCDTASAVNKIGINLMTTINRVLRAVTFHCNSSAADLTNAFSRQAATDVTVLKYFTKPDNSTWSYRVGYSDAALISNNWYQPLLLNANEKRLQITTLQEGGQANTQYKARPLSALIVSVFVQTNVSSSPVLYSISWGAAGLKNSTRLLDSQSGNNQYDITNAINSVFSGAVVAVSRAARSPFIEYSVTFTASFAAAVTDGFSAVAYTRISGGSGGSNSPTAGAVVSSAVFVLKLQDANNFPIFYDSKHPDGYARSGRYTCYLRSLGYNPWSFYAGNLNPGVVAEVVMRPYSIGYSVLEEAIKAGIPTASMINKANQVVAANANSVSYAVMELGGNLDARFQANLADGASALVWPLSGFTYFIVRSRTHIGDCSRRKAAMQFLYDFYHSSTVKQIAAGLGFATLPDFIRDIIVNKMVNSVMCSSGEYALDQYRLQQAPVLSAQGFLPTLSTYALTFNALDTAVQFGSTVSSNSVTLWQNFAASPDSYVGAFTLLRSKDQKLQLYGSATNVLTNAFAHVAVVALYHLNSFSAGTTAPLQLTTDILAGVFSGSILYWNDTAIQNANGAFAKFLPYKRIKVVVRTGEADDTTALFVRYLAMKSPSFSAAYGLSPSSDTSQLNFASRIQPAYLISATSNYLVDYAVTFGDGYIGYYLQTSTPTAQVAAFCNVDGCPTAAAILPNNNGQSLTACANDPATLVQSETISTYDLMVSTAPGCYPITGTVDYSIFSGVSASCPAPHSTGSEPTVVTRVRFSTFLYNGSAVVQPLGPVYSMSSTPLVARAQVYSSVCDVTCGGKKFGYTYCGYRDCTWADGDFEQEVSTCDASALQRTVSYQLKPGSTCLLVSKPSSVSIPCVHVPTSSGIGITAYVIAGIGAFICIIFLVMTILHRDKPIIKRSQPIFLDLFISGALLLNLTIATFIGTNTDVTCLLRPWAFNIAAIIMFAPLVLKLYRLDRLFNNKKLRKMKISDFMVARQVLLVLLLGIVILVLWSVLERPRSISIATAYPSVLAPVDDVRCSTNLRQTFEAVMLAFQGLLLGFGILEAITTWKIPSDLSEAKHFAIAIYNIAVVGGIAYFLSNFLGTTAVGASIILRSFGVFISATFSVFIIVLPKLLVVEGVFQFTPSTNAFVVENRESLSSEAPVVSAAARVSTMSTRVAPAPVEPVLLVQPAAVVSGVAPPSNLATMHENPNEGNGQVPMPAISAPPKVNKEEENEEGGKEGGNNVATKESGEVVPFEVERVEVVVQPPAESLESTRPAELTPTNGADTKTSDSKNTWV